MANSMSRRFTQFAALMAVAMIATLMSASLAFANTTVNVSFEDPDNDGVTISKTVDLTALAAASTSDNDAPYFAQFNKSGWTVLATSANNYVPVKEALQNALDQYNAEKSTNYALADIWTTGNTLQLADSKQAYTKYNPTYADVMNTNYFYNAFTNGDTAFGSTGWTNPWTLSATGFSASVANPQTAGAVLALSWGQSHIDSADTTTTCATAAGTAYDAIAATSAPRMFYGANDGDMTAGKRFCSDIISIAIQ